MPKGHDVYSVLLFLVVMYSSTCSWYISGTVAGPESLAEAALEKPLFPFGSQRGRGRRRGAGRAEETLSERMGEVVQDTW